MLLALDQGTTSCRTFAFAEDGSPLGSAQREFSQFFPAAGQVEHDAEQILAVQLETLDEAWRQAGSGTVSAVGITNQRETVVVWERATGRPIHRAIVWQDRRTAERLAALRAHAGAVAAATGLPLDPYFSAAKIAWILDRVPGARRRAERGELCAGTIDSWLLFRLTNGTVFATEPSNASRTSLFDLRTGAFSQELCNLFAVPMRCLPEVRDSAGSFGTTQRGWPITGVLGDQQAALFGHGCLRPGQGKCTYGTGAFVLQQVGERVPAPAHGLLATVAWRIGGRTSYALEGSVLVCGAAVQWLRDAMGLVQSAAGIEALARSVADSGGVVFVPAFTGLGTPHWDPSARGAIVGLSRGTTRAHLARAAIEAMALQVDEVLTAMAASGTAISELAVDGGAAANTLLLELQAAIGGVPVVRPGFLETTAFGAFRMALLGQGSHARVEDLPRLPGTAVRVAAAGANGPGGGDVEGLRRRWQAAVLRARGWATV
jgi:glycerol kinase